MIMPELRKTDSARHVQKDESPCRVTTHFRQRWPPGEGREDFVRGRSICRLPWKKECRKREEGGNKSAEERTVILGQCDIEHP